jgi:L-aminopeptidase/D-esterase-like protein
VEAAAGVTAELFARSQHKDLPLVAGAVIYDNAIFETLSGQGNGSYPDKALGQAALNAVRPGQFPLGPRGAGASAAVGPYGREEPAGQGAAYRRIGAIRVAVFTVVNAWGVLVDRRGQVVRGGIDPQTGQRFSPLEAAEQAFIADETTSNSDATPQPVGLTNNTTLTVVVTNVALSQDEGESNPLRQFGRQVHASMARAIQPFHTIGDGDVLFAVTTGEVANERIDARDLGVVASELAWDAVLSSFDPETKR